MVQGVAEAAAHPETAASPAVTPAGASSPLHQFAGSRKLVTPPLIIHSDAGPLSAQAAFVLAADPRATAVILRGYVTAHWTDTVAGGRSPTRHGLIVPRSWEITLGS